MEETHIYLHAIRSVPSMTDAGLRKILECFNGDAVKAWKSSAFPSSLKLGPIAKKAWGQRHELIPDVHTNADILERQDIRIVIATDPDYPASLTEIPDHPYFLYVRGTLPRPGQPLLAVVGSRKFTSYGKQACVSLVRDLTRAGIDIVSGLAFGIDKIAHVTALESNGATWAVLGSGVDDDGITPSTHQALGKEIVTVGALISEYPPGSTPNPKNFPERNRIVAGMTLGTLVIEAAEKSGSLITARLALEYNREVFAVPGSIFSSLAQGTNTLLKKGAIPVTNAQDVLQVITGHSSLENFAVKKVSTFTPLEEKLIKMLSFETLHIDEMVKQTGYSIAEVSSALMLLEIKKHTKHIGNQQYILYT